MNTPKYKPGQWVTHEGKRKQITLAGNSLYTDTPVYNLDDDPTIYPETELSPSNKYEIGDFVWFLRNENIYRVKVYKVVNTLTGYMYYVERDNETFYESRLYHSKIELLNSLKFIDLCKN